MKDNFDTHKFLFTLKHNNDFLGYSVEFLDRNNNLLLITLSNLDVGTSPVSCKLYDENNDKYIVPFIRIRKIYKNNELVWDNSETDLSKVKVIKGFK